MIYLERYKKLKRIGTIPHDYLRMRTSEVATIINQLRACSENLQTKLQQMERSSSIDSLLAQNDLN